MPQWGRESHTVELTAAMRRQIGGWGSGQSTRHHLTCCDSGIYSSWLHASRRAGTLPRRLAPHVGDTAQGNRGGYL